MLEYRQIVDCFLHPVGLVHLSHISDILQNSLLLVFLLASWETWKLSEIEICVNLENLRNRV